MYYPNPRHFSLALLVLALGSFGGISAMSFESDDMFPRELAEQTDSFSQDSGSICDFTEADIEALEQTTLQLYTNLQRTQVVVRESKNDPDTY